MGDIKISKETTAVVKRIDKLSGEIKEVEITDIQSLNFAADFLKEIKIQKTKLEEERKKLTRPLDSAKKTIMDWFRPQETRLEEAELALKKKIAIFQAEERARAEERAKQAAEEAKKRQAEETARLQKAEADAELAGDVEAIQEIEQQKAVVSTMESVASVVVEVPKAEGVSEVRNWKGEVVDLSAFLKYVVETGLFINVIEVSPKELNALARTIKGTKEIPGLRFKQEVSISVR